MQKFSVPDVLDVFPMPRNHIYDILSHNNHVKQEILEGQ